MSNFNINQVPNTIPGGLAWCIAGIKVLFGRVSSLMSSSSTAGGQIRCLFDHYNTVGNVGSAETDLYSDTIVGDTLAANGDKLQVIYAGNCTNPTSKQLRVYFGGSVIYIPGLFDNSTLSWVLEGVLIRVSATVIRYTFNCINTTLSVVDPFVITGELTGLTLSSSNILKITGEVSGPDIANNDITAAMGSISWISHA